MLYNKNQLVKRLQESGKEFLTEKELLSLATPYINNISQVIASLKKAIDKGYTGEYTIHFISQIASISRRTLYRWEDEKIFCRKDNLLNIIDLYHTLTLIESRQTKHLN